MPAYKDNRQGTWYASFYFENWQGVKQKKLKRGFATKKDALAWEREFLLQQAADLTMTFEAFVEIYITDKKKRLRENTWSVKEHIIRTKILPYFKEKRLSEIKPRDVIAWQDKAEQLSPQFEMGLNAQKQFAQRDVARNVQNRGRSKVVELKAIVFQKPSEERMDCKPDAP